MEMLHVMNQQQHPLVNVLMPELDSALKRRSLRMRRSDRRHATSLRLDPELLEYQIAVPRRHAN